MIHIDGSYGEAGGQIIRTAIALSAVTGKECRIENIRAGRCNPGLQAQHLTGVLAVAKLCNAKLKGAEICSKEIEFVPNKILGGSYSFNVGTAGAIPLVLQALMIPAIHAEKEVKIKITGGTSVRWSPTFYYIQKVTLEILKKMGYKATLDLEKHGFYPKGGGLVKAEIMPSSLKPIELLDRGKLLSITGIITATEDLKKAQVAERMQKIRVSLFNEFSVNSDIKIDYVNSLSTGCAIDLFAHYENSIIGASAIGELRKKAEDVAREAFDFLVKQHKSEAPLDEHSGDQILPYMALAEGPSKIKVSHISEHCRTNIWAIEKFLPVKFRIDEKNKIIEKL